MKESTKIDFIISYFNYWKIKLELDNICKTEIKKDNRIKYRADVGRDSNTGIYYIRFNSKLIGTRIEIIHLILHEIGHVIHDFRIQDPIKHEYLAELFALKTAKEYYPKYYKSMVKESIKVLTIPKQSKYHIEGYKRALKELKEI